MKSHWPMAAVLLCLTASLAAQTPAKPDPAAEAAAAMERAKRQAAGPMRIILEASKARRKPGEGDATSVASPSAAAAAAPLEAVGLRTVASRSATPAAVANPPANASTAAVSPVISPAIFPAAVAAPSAPALISATPSGTVVSSGTNVERVTTQVTLEAGALGSRPTSTAVSNLESSTVVGPIVAPLAVAPKIGNPQMQAGDRVRLLSMVEPEVPQRVLDEMGRNATVQVELLLRTDGSVASVDLVSPAPRGLLRMLAPSLEQWKFAPLIAQRKHRVELLFNVER